MKKFIVLFLLLGFAAFFNSCSEDSVSPTPDAGEEELITTVRLTLTNTANSADVATVTWQDLDGEGGNAPTIGTLTLNAGVTYSGTVEFLNETENPAEDITEEVRDENDEHLVAYAFSGSAAVGLNFQYADQDNNGFPLGLSFTLAVVQGTNGNAVLNVILYHYDDVAKNGITPSNETDIDVDIPIIIN